MKNFILFFALVLMGSVCIAQNSNDPIEVKKGFGTLVLSQNGQTLSPNMALETMRDNPAAYNEMKAAKGNNDIATVLGMAGGGLIGWPLGSAIGGGKPNWTLAGIGAGLVAVSIPFSSAYSNRARKATELYNGSGPTGMRDLRFNLGLSGQGLGLNLKF